MQDIGQPKDFISGTCLYLSHLTHQGSKQLVDPSQNKWVVGGNVLVDPSAKIDPTAVIGPNVTIGPKVTVGKGARLQRCVIMEGARIKDHSWIKSSMFVLLSLNYLLPMAHACFDSIGWNSTVGRWCRVDNTTVLGDDVNVKDELSLNGASGAFTGDARNAADRFLADVSPPLPRVHSLAPQVGLGIYPPTRHHHVKSPLTHTSHTHTHTPGYPFRSLPSVPSSRVFAFDRRFFPFLRNRKQRRSSLSAHAPPPLLDLLTGEEQGTLSGAHGSPSLSACMDSFTSIEYREPRETQSRSVRGNVKAHRELRTTNGDVL